MTVSRDTVRLLAIGWAILALAGLSVVAVLSAQLAWRAYAGRPAAPAIAPAPAAAAQSAALLRAQAAAAAKGEIAAPAAGVTGTTALPDLPIPADAVIPAPGEVGVIPAQPFSLAGISPIDQQRARECLTAAIYYEAASEPDAGQSAVAQVILNRVRHPAFPATVCGVVYQGSEHAGCQFSFACDGAMARVPQRAAWIRAARAANMALAGYVYAPVGLATHYHTYAVTPAWNRSLVMTDVVGAHFFHRWKGYWGTPAAFSQRYRGGEPLPGPHARILPLPEAIDPRLLAGLAPPISTPPAANGQTPAPTTPAAAITPATQVKPAYADSGAYIDAAPKKPVVPEDNLPPASQILDKWKDSGKPLR